MNKRLWRMRREREREHVYLQCDIITSKEHPFLALNHIVWLPFSGYYAQLNSLLQADVVLFVLIKLVIQLYYFAVHTILPLERAFRFYKNTHRTG
jgi:hypothetical protein